MSVNVDSVLRSTVRILSSQKCAEPVFAESVDKARAAVAELMEKAEALVTAARVLAVTDEPERWREHVRLHATATDAALARCKGE